MNRLLVVALFAACVVNIACLCGHLSASAPAPLILGAARAADAAAPARGFGNALEARGQPPARYANGNPVIPAPARM